MTRGRTVTRSSSPFPFPGSLLPVLHPPRSVKHHQSSSSSKADIPTVITPQDTPMPAIRNRRRRSTVSLPDIENGEANVPVRSKRKPTPAALPLSPRTLNTELRGRSLAQNEKPEPITDFEFTTDSIQPPPIDQIFSSPRSPRLELSFDEEIPAPSAQFQDSLEPQKGSGLFYMDSFAPESEFDDLTTQLEETTVRAARSRAQQRERAARRWETLCSARIRFLKEQASHAVIFAEMAAAATRPLVTSPTLFSVFGASSPSPPLIVPSSPFGAYGAPLSRMRSPSPYSVCGESLDLAAMSSASGREELEALCDPTSTDSRPLVDRMICRLHEFDYDDISVDGLTEAECRQLRTETRKRRRLDRQRAYELGILLELKRRQIGRSRSSSSSSSSSSDSSTSSSSSSDSDCEEPATPPQICCSVQSVDHLIAKMHMKRKEKGQRTFTSSVAAREVFEARGCSSLRMAVHSTIEVRPKFARKRSHSTKSAFSEIFTLSGSPFGLGSTAWLKEKRRLTSLDRE